MTLHETVENLKKGGIASAFGITGIIIVVILFRVGILIKNILYPPKIEPANHAYGKLPPLVFPPNVVDENLTYTKNTVTGELPKFPDRLNIYPLVNPPPTFGNIDRARKKASNLGFINTSGLAIPEISLGNANYEWDESEELERKLLFNIVNFDFKLNSRYLVYTPVLYAQKLSDQASAIDTVTGFLTGIQLLPDDLDLTKTKNPDTAIPYITAPQLYDIRNSQLIPTTSLSKAKIIRVDLYQKDVEYELSTGITGEDNVLQRTTIKLPIMYPHPPYSTMSFWVGSGKQKAEVVQADYVHKQYTVPVDQEVTYPLKSAEDAFIELQHGQAYIASYTGTSKEILVDNVYLAYYLGQDKQDYLMPIIVFEGGNGFFAYVSAVNNDWVQGNSGDASQDTGGTGQ